MKFTGKVDEPRQAAAIGSRCCQPRSKLAFRRSLLIRATAEDAAFSSSALDYCTTGSTNHVDIIEQGALVVDAERLRSLLAATPDKARLTFEATAGALIVRRDQFHWQLQATDVEDFPVLLSPRAPLLQFSLTATDAQTLFGPAIGVAIAQDDSRMYLGGAFVHDGGSGRLVVCTTNGMTLVRRHTDVLGAEHLPRNGNAHGILVPPWACREILAICRPDGCTLTTDGRLIEARTADACFVSKLIDLPFPDYHYVIPPPHSAAAEIDTKLLGVALVRLNAASTMGKAPIVGLTWDAHTDASTVFLELAREPGVVADSIPASVSGDGRLAFDAIRLGDLLGALGLLRVRIRASNPARFEPTDGTQLLALLSTAAWPRPQIAEAAA